MMPADKPSPPPYCLLAAIVFAAVLIAVGMARADEPAHKTGDIIIDIPPPPTRTLTGATYPPLRGVTFNVGDTVRLGRAIDDGRPPVVSTSLASVQGSASTRFSGRRH
jgi:hypothetical protein